MPGGVVCAFRRGELFLHHAFGTRDDEQPATLDTIYDLASLTKPLATAASIVTLVEQGQLHLGAKLPDLLGEAASHLAGVTVLHLLTHTSGLPAWTACYEKGLGLDAAVGAILRLPTAPVGTKYEYSCLNFILLGRIIEQLSGQSLDAFAREKVWAPLGLNTLSFHPDPSLRSQIAPTRSEEGPDRDHDLVGVVHDGNARGIGGVSGNAGLFGTALDVARFGEALRTPGALFGAPTLARVFENQNKPEIGAHTFLFFAQGNGFCPSGDLLSPRAVGHSGYTGTFLTLDPAYDLTVVTLTNSVFARPPGGKAKWLPVRRKFLNALAGALV